MTEDGTYKAQLIVSKNRIAPIKIVDIVRLELSGAVVGKRLRLFIQAEVRYNFTAVYHIEDSEIVKAMISKESYGFDTFAANRIGEIQQKTDPQEWFLDSGRFEYCRLGDQRKNPWRAGPCSIWQTGPEFLKQPVEKWPVSSQTNVEKFPERHKVVMTTNAKEIETLVTRTNIGRFSKIELLLNTTVRILKLYKQYKKSAKHSLGSAVEKNKLAVADRDSAERFWIKDAQESIAKEV